MDASRPAPHLRQSVAAIGIEIEHTEAALNHISGARGGIVGVYPPYNYEAELKDC